jgi:hypothetical protein
MGRRCRRRRFEFDATELDLLVVDPEPPMLHTRVTISFTRDKFTGFVLPFVVEWQDMAGEDSSLPLSEKSAQSSDGLGEGKDLSDGGK